MREKRRQKKGENESERVAGERRRERFAGYNRKAQHTHKYHLPGLAHLRVRERERERESERERDKGGEGGKENAQVATNGCCVHAEVQRRIHSL